jgi:hypothetical protein
MRKLAGSFFNRHAVTDASCYTRCSYGYAYGNGGSIRRRRFARIRVRCPHTHHGYHDAPAPTPCKHTVSDLFHSPPGVLFTFPSRYLFTIGLEEYLALGVSPPGFTPAIHVLRYSGTTTRETYSFSCTGLLPSGAVLSSTFH